MPIFMNDFLNKIVLSPYNTYVNNDICPQAMRKT